MKHIGLLFLKLSVLISGMEVLASTDPICKPLIPSETRIVEDPGSETSIPARYTLTLEQNGTYTVGIPIRFIPASAQFEAHVQNCYREFSNHIDSSSSPKLTFTLHTPSNPGKALYFNDVTLDPAVQRVNSRAYNPVRDNDCSTIVHEGLHLLGLVDEYEEFDLSQAPGMNCRFVPGVKTIMSSSRATYADVTGVSQKCSCAKDSSCAKVMEKDSFLKKLYVQSGEKRFYLPKWFSGECKARSNIALKKKISELEANSSFPIEKYDHRSLSYSHVAGVNKEMAYVATVDCQCSQYDQNCKDRIPKAVEYIKENFDKYAGMFCPAGSVTDGEMSSTPLEDESPSAVLKDLKFVLKTLPTKSLIAPSHVQKIISAGCKTQATNYNECASWAYKGTRTQSCDKRPQKCFDDRHYLGIPW